jgi:hypothetical protein
MTKVLTGRTITLKRRRFPERAINIIKPGQRIFIGSACGEPQVLVRALASARNTSQVLEIVRMMSHESAPADRNRHQDLTNIIGASAYLSGIGLFGEFCAQPALHHPHEHVRRPGACLSAANCPSMWP